MANPSRERVWDAQGCPWWHVSPSVHSEPADYAWCKPDAVGSIEKELPPGMVLCRCRANPLRSGIVILFASRRLRYEVGFVRALHDGLETQVGAFGADVRRPIQPGLDFNFIRS